MSGSAIWNPVMTTKILIIDDDPITRLLAAEKLTEENFRVFEAANGQQGLAMIKQIKPDLVLLDVIMPDIDGYDVCKEIRRNPELASLPVKEKDKRKQKCRKRKKNKKRTW